MANLQMPGNATTKASNYKRACEKVFDACADLCKATKCKTDSACINRIQGQVNQLKTSYSNSQATPVKAGQYKDDKARNTLVNNTITALCSVCISWCQGA